MSSILQQMAIKQIKTKSEARKLMKSQQSIKVHNSYELKLPKTPIQSQMPQSSMQQFRKTMTDGKFSLQIEANRKTLLDDIFQTMNPTFKRDLLEIILQQFETEFFRICNEFNHTLLIDKYNSYQQTMNKFLKHILLFVDENQNTTINAQEELIHKEQQINMLQTQYAQLQQQFIQSNSGNQDRTNQKLKKSEQAKKQSELYMENLRLRNEVERIQDRFKQMEHQTNVQNLIVEMETIKRKSQEKITDLLRENQLKEKQLQKLNLHFQNIKAQYSKLENESKAYQTVFEANKQQLDKILLDNESNSLLMIRYRETAWMQKEDFEMRLYLYKEELSVAKKAQEKLQQLQSKLDRFQIEKSKEIEPPPNKQYEKEKTGFEKFNDLFSNDKTFFRLSQQALLQEKSRIVNRVGHSVGVMENYFNSQEVQLEKLTIGYGPFVNLIEHHKKSLETEFVGLQYKKPSLHLLVTCRHILDGMWNSFQMDKLCNFPEFAYSWLMNFKVDLQEKCMKALTTDPHRVDDQVMRFVVDLSNPQLEKNWECITIQEFINDFTSSDELYFFLYARHMLFRGPQSIFKPSMFEANNFVPLLQAEFVANHLLSQYENSTLLQVRRILKEKSHRKISNKNIYIVDSAFVLRILLEFYRCERRNRYKMFKVAFGSRSSNLSFKQFRIVLVSNYPDISDLELASLYRQAYSFTGSGVSVDSFYTIASDNGFFIKHLKLNTFNLPPKIENDQIAFEPQSQIFVLIAEAHKRFQSFPYQEILLELGCEEIFIKIRQLGILVENQFNQIQTNGPNFLKYFDTYMELLRKINYILYSRLILRDQNPFAIEFRKNQEEKSKSQSIKELPGVDNFNRQYLRMDEYMTELDLLKGTLESFEHLTSFLETRTRHRKQIEMSQSVASKKIQKFIRKKMNKFYSFVSSLLSAKFKSTLKQK